MQKEICFVFFLKMTTTPEENIAAMRYVISIQMENTSIPRALFDFYFLFALQWEDINDCNELSHPFNHAGKLSCCVIRLWSGWNDCVDEYGAKLLLQIGSWKEIRHFCLFRSHYLTLNVICNIDDGIIHSQRCSFCNQTHWVSVKHWFCSNQNSIAGFQI